MSSDRFHRAAELFLRIKSLPEPIRPEVIDEACGADAGLRQEVARLLRAGDLPTPFRALADDLGAVQADIRSSLLAA